MSATAKTEPSEDFKSLAPELQLDQIAEFLRQKGDYVKTLDVAKQFYGPKATCGKINPQLYKLLAAGRASKITEEGGAKPKWKAV